jgi:hypothetical protein
VQHSVDDLGVVSPIGILPLARRVLQAFTDVRQWRLK